MLKVIINAFGPDRPGIVYKLSRIIFSLKGNIEESKMIRLESDLTLLMLIALPDSNFSLLEEKLSNLANLNISFKITKKNPTKIECHYFKFSVNVADNEGIIYTFSELFNKYKINIEKMETEVSYASITGAPVFNLKSKLSSQTNLNQVELELELKKIAEDNNIDYSFNKLSN